MNIWHKEPELEALNRRGEGNFVGHLGIRYVSITADSLTAAMRVDAKMHQPYGILHGGASMALAETVGSAAGNLCVDPDRFVCVGMEINGNHVRPVRQGEIRATARPLHLGTRTQVWDISIADERGRLVCAARLTLAVLPRRRD